MRHASFGNFFRRRLAAIETAFTPKYMRIERALYSHQIDRLTTREVDSGDRMPNTIVNYDGSITMSPQQAACQKLSGDSRGFARHCAISESGSGNGKLPLANALCRD